MKAIPLKAMRWLAPLLVISAPPASAETALPSAIVAEIEILNEAREKDFATARERIADLKEKYLKALKKTKASAQKAGNLGTLLAADAEIKRMNSGNDDGAVPKDAEVARLKRTYIKALEDRKKEVARHDAEADQRHAAGIDLIVADLTKAGKIEEAQRVQQYKKRAGKAPAQPDLADTKPPSATPPSATPPSATPPSATPPRPAAPAEPVASSADKATGDIIGTTWKVRNPKGTTITFLAEGKIRGKSSGIGLHSYEIIGANQVRIRWGKTGGGGEKKEYEIDARRGLMKGARDGSTWERLDPLLE